MLSSLVLTTLFVGCESSGGFCCKGEIGGALNELQEIRYDAPVAVLDNRTFEDLYFFNCENSYDRDENNQSIVRCDWNITVNGEYSILEASGTEVNVSRYYDTMTNFITVELTVTDNEGETNTTTKQFNVGEY